MSSPKCFTVAESTIFSFSEDFSLQCGCLALQVSDMKIITPGHRYELENFAFPENAGQIIQFIEKRPVNEEVLVAGGSLPAGAALELVNDGCTNETILAVLIDRLNYLNAKFQCRENAIAITHIETALLWLNKRTTDRKARGVEGQHKA